MHAEFRTATLSKKENNEYPECCRGVCRGRWLARGSLRSSIPEWAGVRSVVFRFVKDRYGTTKMGRDILAAHSRRQLAKPYFDFGTFGV